MSAMTFAELAEKIAEMTDEQKAQPIVGEHFNQFFDFVKLEIVPKDRRWVWADEVHVPDGHHYLSFH